MGTDIVALRKPKIQFNNIREDELDDEYPYPYPQKECIDSHQIWKKWRDSDIDSWPNCLQNFWWKIHDYKSAQIYIKKIRKYYPNDIDLLQFTFWLEKFDEDIIFEISI